MNRSCARGGICCRLPAGIRLAAWLVCATVISALAGCLMPTSPEPSAWQRDPKACASCGTADAKPSADDSKDVPAHTKPQTLPEAIHAYLCCLQTPPALREAADKSDKADKDDSSKKDDKQNKNGKVNGDKEKDKDDKGKGEKNPKGEKDQPEGEKDKDKANGEDKDKANGDADKEKEKEPDHPWYSAHGQATLVTQAHSSFFAPYTGPNSLLPNEPDATSVTGTLFLDTRLWQGGEVIFNPEFAGGRGFSNTTGIAGFPNGEITRVGLVEPTPYIARLFLRQTFGLGGELEDVPDEPNELPGKRDSNRFTVSIGKVSATDFFDDNEYSHDPRTQFLPWSIMYNGAWDYPANVRGYTYGFSMEYHTKDFTVTYGIFAEPAVANGAALDPHFLKANGQAVEWEQRYKLFDEKGTIRLMTYLNHADMGNYSEALEEMPVDPNVIDTRAYRYKYGVCVSWDQAINNDLGIFGRLGWDDGHSEAWAFTAIDRLAEIGLALKGTCWCRPNDVVGMAYAIEGLEGSHRNYLAAGGLDFIIGDGALRYGPEEIAEIYYNYQIIKGIFFTLDAQGVDHPAYNRDRGPVAIFSGRFHIEF